MTQESTSDVFTAVAPQPGETRAATWESWCRNNPTHQHAAPYAYSDTYIRALARSWLAKNGSGNWSATSLRALHDFIRGDDKASDGILAGLGFARVIVKVES